MKPVKNLVLALLLVIALSGITLAGEVPIPPSPATAPPRATTTDIDDDSTPLSDPNAVKSGETVETSDYLMFEALMALIYLY